MHCELRIVSSVRVTDQSAPQLCAGMSMGRYKGVGMPRAKKKKMEEVEAAQAMQLKMAAFSWCLLSSLCCTQALLLRMPRLASTS